MDGGRGEGAGFVAPRDNGQRDRTAFWGGEGGEFDVIIPNGELAILEGARPLTVAIPSQLSGQ